LASEEASADDAWKRAILETKSEDVVRFEVWAEIFPSTSDRAYETVPRVMRTSFIEEWQGSEEGGRVATVRDQVGNPAAQTLVPFTGQTAGLIHDVLPAAEILRAMVAGRS
jgi:enoyl-[acyl-carrier protein] reductase II